MTNDQTPNKESEIVDLRFLSKAIYRNKWWVVLFTLLGLVYGMRDVRGFEPKFVMDMIVEPMSRTAAQTGGTQLQSFAKVIGVTGQGGGQSMSQIQRLEMLFSSHSLALRLQEKHDLFHKVFKNNWDESTKSWIAPTGWRFEMEEKIRDYLRLGRWSAPNIESFAQYLGAVVVVNQVMSTSARRLRVVHRDAEFGQFLLTTIFNEADSLLRRRDMATNLKDRQYLRKRLEIESNSNSRSILYSMLEQQEQARMLLDRGDNYAARVVEPVRILLHKTKPNLTIMLFVPGVIALFGAVMIICIVALFRSE